MWKTGPSPVVPFLMVGVLGLVVFGPTLMSLLEFAQPLIQMGDEGGFYPLMMMLPLLLLLLIHLISSCCPTYGVGSSTRLQSRSYSSDASGFGWGSFFLLVLFFVLYNIW